MKKELTLQEIQEIQTGLLISLHDFCEKNQLRYFLTGGTLLGAIRHKGFIPWDDDIDVVMPRVDYNWFIAQYKSEENMDVISVQKQNDYYLSFAKLVKTDTFLQEDVDSNCILGVNIDVFPLDNMSDKYSAAKRLYWQTDWLRKLAALKIIRCKKERNCFKNSVLFFGKKIFAFYKLKDILRLLDRKSQKYVSSDITKYICVAVIATYEKEIVRGEWYAESVLVTFEKNKFHAPVGHHEILTCLYNDYMQLPPKEKQKTHHTYSAWKKTGEAD